MKHCIQYFDPCCSGCPFQIAGGKQEQWGKDYEEGKDMGCREREEKGAAEEEEEEEERRT
jgi:hypothetical protein